MFEQCSNKYRTTSYLCYYTPIQNWIHVHTRSAPDEAKPGNNSEFPILTTINQ